MSIIKIAHNKEGYKIITLNEKEYKEQLEKFIKLTFIMCLVILVSKLFAEPKLHYDIYKTNKEILSLEEDIYKLEFDFNYEKIQELETKNKKIDEEILKYNSNVKNIDAVLSKIILKDKLEVLTTNNNITKDLLNLQEKRPIIKYLIESHEEEITNGNKKDLEKNIRELKMLIIDISNYKDIDLGEEALNALLTDLISDLEKLEKISNK